MTEKSKLTESRQRKEHLVKVLYVNLVENHSRAVTLKIVSVIVHLR